MIEGQTQIDLGAYMNQSIRNIMAKAYKNMLSNPREAKFVYRMQMLFLKSEKRRKKMLEIEGLEVPPFLISSISTTYAITASQRTIIQNARTRSLESSGRTSSPKLPTWVSTSHSLPVASLSCEKTFWNTLPR